LWFLPPVIFRRPSTAADGDVEGLIRDLFRHTIGTGGADPGSLQDFDFEGDASG
jgi:hypothetical protein